MISHPPAPEDIGQLAAEGEHRRHREQNTADVHDTAGRRKAYSF